MEVASLVNPTDAWLISSATQTSQVLPPSKNFYTVDLTAVPTQTKCFREKSLCLNPNLNFKVKKDAKKRYGVLF
jgi:hypothetical protein